MLKRDLLLFSLDLTEVQTLGCLALVCMWCDFNDRLTLFCSELPLMKGLCTDLCEYYLLPLEPRVVVFSDCEAWRRSLRFATLKRVVVEFKGLLCRVVSAAWGERRTARAEGFTVFLLWRGFPKRTEEGEPLGLRQTEDHLLDSGAASSGERSSALSVSVVDFYLRPISFISNTDELWLYWNMLFKNKP